jgi:hypothetical protein
MSPLAQVSHTSEILPRTGDWVTQVKILTASLNNLRLRGVCLGGVDVAKHC